MNNFAFTAKIHSVNVSLKKIAQLLNRERITLLIVALQFPVLSKNFFIIYEDSILKMRQISIALNVQMDVQNAKF